MTSGGYDPDRMIFEDLDLSDLNMVRSYLEHPVTVALDDDLARQLRALPAAEQIPELEQTLAKVSAMRDEVTRVIGSDLPPEDPRLQLLLGMERNVWLIERRIAELENESS